MEKLTDLILSLQKKRDLFSYDEAATKQTIILPILQCLGWNVFDRNSVFPEYEVGRRKVDYSLRIFSQNKAFIEVKRINVDLHNHQEQLLDYSYREGAQFAVLTNGVTWWFFLPFKGGKWEQRRFYTIDIFDQDSTRIVRKLVSFLSFENIQSGEAVKLAEKTLDESQRKRAINNAIPKALKNLLLEPDDLFIELVIEETEKMCGYRPNHSTVKNKILEINLFQSMQDLNKINTGETYEKVVPKKFKVSRGNSKRSWADYCRTALEELGGKASLKEIYKKVDEIRRINDEKRIKDPTAAIRNALESHSRGKGKDLFIPEKIGSGIWMLK